MAVPSGIICEFITSNVLQGTGSGTTLFYQTSSGGIEHGAITLSDPDGSSDDVRSFEFHSSSAALVMNAATFASSRSRFDDYSLYFVVGDNVVELPFTSVDNFGNNRASWFDYANNLPAWFSSLTGTIEFGLVIADAGQSAAVQKYVANDLEDPDPALAANVTGAVLALGGVRASGNANTDWVFRSGDTLTVGDKTLTIGNLSWQVHQLGWSDHDTLLWFQRRTAGNAVVADGRELETALNGDKTIYVKVDDNIFSKAIPASGNNIQAFGGRNFGFVVSGAITTTANRGTAGTSTYSWIIADNGISEANINAYINADFGKRRYFGSTLVDKLYFGSDEVSKLYYGDTLVYES